MSENNQELQNQTPESEEQSLSEVLRVRREKLSDLQAQGKDPFQQTSYKTDAYANDIQEHFEEYEGKSVSLAGRIMAWRDMGKASFFDLRDSSGRIQLYVKIDMIGEECFAQLKYWDIGDIIGVRGEVFRTRRGEV